MDCSAVVLNKLLTERNLDIWSRIKLVYLDPAFSGLYSAISKYYDNYSKIPSLISVVYRVQKVIQPYLVCQSTHPRTQAIAQTHDKNRRDWQD